MRICKTVVLMWLAGVAIAASAYAQQFSAYLSSSFDQPSGSAYAYAQTTADYSTGYYYTVCTGIIAQGERDGYTSDQWDEYENSNSLTCDATDAEVSWSFSVPTSTIYIEFFGQHYEDVDYYVYQFDPSCGYDCYYYWDAYEFSVLGIPNGSNEGGGATIYLPGPPAVSTAEYQFFQQTQAEQGQYCFYPSSETSTYEGKDTSQGAYVGLFSGHLYNPGGFADYTGRTVGEAVYVTSDTCWFSGSPFDRPTTGNFNDAGQWTVSGSAYATGPVYDGVSAATAVGNYYQARGPCNAFTATQIMSISSCRSSIPTYVYDPGHTLKFDIGTSTMTATRAGAFGAAQ
jgi:hypothetical protein